MNERLPGDATQIQIADLGHPVYLANSRGTMYSRKTTSIGTPADNPGTFWDYTVDDMAKDVVASVKAMYEDADNQKGWHISYSQGTT